MNNTTINKDNIQKDQEKRRNITMKQKTMPNRKNYQWRKMTKQEEENDDETHPKDTKQDQSVLQGDTKTQKWRKTTYQKIKQ